MCSAWEVESTSLDPEVADVDEVDITRTIGGGAMHQ